MAQYDKLINLGLLNQFLTKAKTIFAPKITASGILKGDGAGNISAATAGTDYATPALVKVSDTQPTESENKLWVDTDGGSGNSYEVPTVAEMQAADNSILGNLAMIESSPATQAHAVGDYIVYNGQLYEVTAAIAQGESLTVGTNCKTITSGGLNSLIDRIQTPVSTRIYPASNSNVTDNHLMTITALGKICILSGWYQLSTSTSPRTLFSIPAQYAAAQVIYLFSRDTNNAVYGGYVLGKNFVMESTSPSGTYTTTCIYIR